MSTLTEADAYNALMYRVETDVEAARAKVYYQALDESKKMVEACEFIKAIGSAAERKQIALSSESYGDHLKKIEGAAIEWEELRNKRETAALQIEMWRSINSNIKKGNI